MLLISRLNPEADTEDLPAKGFNLVIEMLLISRDVVQDVASFCEIGVSIS